jgi:hypothetical protein
MSEWGGSKMQFFSYTEVKRKFSSPNIGVKKKKTSFLYAIDIDVPYFEGVIK